MKKQNDIVDQMERATLGSFYVDNASVDDARRVGLRPEHFLNGFHQQLCEEIFLLNDRNESFDLLTLTKTMGGSAYEISSLAQAVPSASNCAKYASAVVQNYKKREIQRLSKKNLSDSNTKEPEEILEQWAVETERLSALDHARPQTLKEQIEHLHNTMQSNIKPPSTGKPSIDQIIDGLKTDLIIVAGRPSMGKSILVGDFVRHVALKERLPVSVFSLEMTAEQLLLRFHAAESKVPTGFMKNNNATPEQWLKVLKASESILESKLEIDDSRKLTIPAIRAKCRARNRKEKLGLVVVDYLQLILQHEQADTRANEVALITRALGDLKEDLGCPVVLVSQLSRECEKRTNKRPMLSDLRDSGAIESDADIVIFLYREGYYKDMKNEISAMETEAIVAKNRNGDIGKARLWLDKYCTRFVSDPSQLNESSF